MGDDNSKHTSRSVSRRSYLAAGSSLAAIAVTGCVGGDDNGEDPDGERPDVITNWEDVDRADTEYPVRSDAHYDAGLWMGSEEFFDSMERREEVRYGPSPPPRHPEDESDVIEIDELQFSWTAGEASPAAYFEDLAPVLEALEENIGIPVNGSMFDSRTAQVEARRAHNLHAGKVGTGELPFSIALANTYPISIGLNREELPDGSDFLGAGYRINTFAKMDGDVWSLDDIAGKTIGLAHEGSFSGGQAPAAILDQEVGLSEDEWEANWAGTHEAGYLAMLAGDADLTFSASSSVFRLDGDVDWTETAVIWQSDPVPRGIVGYINVLSEDIKDGIDATFLEGDFSGTVAAEEHGVSERYMEMHYPTHHDIVLQTHEYLETDFDRLEEL